MGGLSMAEGESNTHFNPLLAYLPVLQSLISYKCYFPGSLAFAKQARVRLGVRYCLAVSSKNARRLPRWFGGKDSTLPMQGARG